MYTRRLVIFLLHNNNSIYFTLAILKLPFCGKISQAKQSTFEQLFNLKACDLFTGVLFIYFVHVPVQRPSCFPLNLSHEPLFLCWDHSIAGMKTVELPPPPLFPYQFSRLLRLPRTLSNILHFHGRYGTVFSPLSFTVDYQ